jgi:hypothetical protein
MSHLPVGYRLIIERCKRYATMWYLGGNLMSLLALFDLVGNGRVFLSSVGGGNWVKSIQFHGIQVGRKYPFIRSLQSYAVDLRILKEIA